MSTLPTTLISDAMPPEPSTPSLFDELKRTLRSVPILTAVLALLLIVIVALIAQWLGTSDPIAINPGNRLKSASIDHWMGTDAFGRDIYSRVLYGARVSL